MMETFYTLLDIPMQATVDEIEAAYQRQRARYSPERVAELGDDFRQVAEARSAELERAHAVLTDPTRRQAYDVSLGNRPPTSVQTAQRSGLSRREVLMALGGAVLGLLVIAVVWVVSGRQAATTLPPAAEVNRPAIDFTLPTIDGKPLRLSDYRGNVVLVNFWYTNCAPCREETPALQAAYAQLNGQGLQIIGVNVRDNERNGADGDQDIRKFMADHGVTYPIVLDAGSKVNRDYQVYVLPTSAMIDRAGNIRYLLFSAVTTSEVEALFKKLQQETSAQR
ncbi:MAG: redoxin domain-containing protein [Chloroflexi bacterium SZAS-1]|nr:redoxin domain-containing protein [Chloroflexi bacterium SZAS-1]HNP85593.1 redoxin domain-containing protein [Kouleothrix sp.]